MAVDERLSESRIDELFNAAQEGELPEPTQRTRTRSRVATVDFSRPSKFTKDQERELRRTTETFARTASASLSAALRTQVHIDDMVAVSQMSWSQAVREDASRFLFAVIEIAELETKMLIACERAMILALVDRMCGAVRATSSSNRQFSDVDKALARRAVGYFIEQLSLVWTDFAELTLSFAGFESDPSTAAIANLDEGTLLMATEVRMETGSYALNLLLPFCAVEHSSRIMAATDYAAATRDPEQTARMQESVRGVDVELRAEVAATRMPAKRFASLSVGDVVTLGGTSGAVTVFAQDVPLYRAKPGRDGAWRAVQIETEVSP
jgi:flagellar motor switch protein FliM